MEKDLLSEKRRTPDEVGSFSGSLVSDAAPDVTYTYRGEWQRTDDSVEWNAQIRLADFRKEDEPISGNVLLKGPKEFLSLIRKDIEEQLDNKLKVRKKFRGDTSQPPVRRNGRLKKRGL